MEYLPAVEQSTRGIPLQVNKPAYGDGLVITVKFSLPLNWLHSFSLVYVCNNKTSERTDPDLSQSHSNIPDANCRRKYRDSGGQTRRCGGASDTLSCVEYQPTGSDSL